jgi:hypothetical protein
MVRKREDAWQEFDALLEDLGPWDRRSERSRERF